MNRLTAKFIIMIGWVCRPEGVKDMTYGRIPLFPGGCGNCMRVPLFGGGYSDWRSGCDDRCQTVRICNPACPGEYADVELCVDNCGNLSICIHRPPDNCCGRGRKCRSRC